MDAKQITHALGGKWYRRYGSAPCPVCQAGADRKQNALTLADGNGGRLLLHCKKFGCDFAEILEAVGVSRSDYAAPDLIEVARRSAQDRAEMERRARQANRLWQDAQPIQGSLAETYLRKRGITCDLPLRLRYHSECWHGPTAKRYPAMIALVEGGESFAVHRTYLAPDGSGKADVDPAKLMLGNVAGGAVRLIEAQGPLVVAEGIETALSLSCGLLRTPATVWAALSTSGMRGLNLPAQPARLTVAKDGDKPGREAGHALAERAHALGWQVSILDPGTGADFNDILTGKAVAA